MKMSCSWAINNLRRVSAGLLTYQDGRCISSDMIDSYCTSLELIYRDLLMQQAVDTSVYDYEQIFEMLRQVLLNLHDIQNIQTRVSLPSASNPPVSHNGRVGRPPFFIPQEQLSMLIESRFTAIQMADLIGVSVRTIRRRMFEYGLSIQSTYSEFTDNDLDSIVNDIHKEFPTCGYKQMSGHLMSRGIRVQQKRVRESMRRTDPEGTVARRLHTIRRRHYSVAAPRSLYHIDGNHKLIR